MHIIDNIYIGSRLLQPEIFSKLILNEKVAIVTDAIVAKLFLPQLQEALSQYVVDVIMLPAGESNKNWLAMETILQQLLIGDHDRYSTIISLGGGVIGDLTGLAAALYMRGINWIQIPTTLMAQVDAAIGGKTGCNFLGVKNLIGTFNVPKAIITDIETLQSLPSREYNSGLAEVVKYGMACDAEFFIWLESNKLAIKNREKTALSHMIVRCCEIKLAIIKDDMYDRSQRQILNFGHTFAHAIEAATTFNRYLHGEAVAIGMLLATNLAVKIGMLQPEILDRLYNLLVYLELPTSMSQQGVTLDMLYSYMAKDKKKQADTLNLILPCALGEVRIIKQLNAGFLEGLLQSYV